ncbi:MAG: ferritin-like domain-containing protein [Actinobacteria bacterium]|nr:ferritin-like domain-containing protein [Actinomycetota bacterium]
MDGFDLDRYLRASKRVDLSGVAWDRIGEHPLPEGEARCLAYMMDIESHTAIFLRDLLGTRAAFEPDVTAFLSCWVYEELWHGEAFSRFLGEAGYRLAPDGEATGLDAPYPSRVGRNAWIRRRIAGRGYLSHVATLLGSALYRDFVALHMTWGALNELSTLSAYHLLIARTEHPVLVDVLTRIVKDERRHFAFYRAQARMRLASSPRTRRMVRWGMANLWSVVGTGVRPQPETDHLVAYLFGGPEGLEAARGMDAMLDELPGLAGLHLAVRARGEALRRHRPAGSSRVVRRRPAAAGPVRLHAV